MRNRRTGAIALAGAAALVVTALLTRGGAARLPAYLPPPAAAAPPVATALTARDPDASPNAQAVYRELATLENDARAGRPGGTVIGEHIEAQNELYNAQYGDYPGLKTVGYYYQKAADISGKLPGFVEGDLGPGYDQPGWATGDPRWYDRSDWPGCRPGWTYTDEVTDLLAAVWDGHPSGDAGIFGGSGTDRNCDGSVTVLPDNGGGPAGIVGMSFHEPYPGAPVKSYSGTGCEDSPEAKDPDWFSQVVDYQDNTPQYRALLSDLSYLADHLDYFAAHDIPVLFRPYHEMNTIGCGNSFWWAGQSPSEYQGLWRITYNYLVNTRHLHNLIFVWAPLAWNGKVAGNPAAYYPGSRYVDVVAVDDYTDSPNAPGGDGYWTNDWYRALAGYDKPRMMAENDYVPISSAQPYTLLASPWVIWSTWGDAITGPPERNSTADVKRTYDARAGVITGGGSAQGSSFDWQALHRDN